MKKDSHRILQAFGEVDEYGFTTRNINLGFKKRVWIEFANELCPYCPWKRRDNEKGNASYSERKRMNKTWKHNRNTQYKI